MKSTPPENLRGFVDDRVSDGGYGASNEYVLELIRKDEDRERLRALRGEA